MRILFLGSPGKLTLFRSLIVFCFISLTAGYVNGEILSGSDETAQRMTLSLDRPEMQFGKTNHAAALTENAIARYGRPASGVLIADASWNDWGNGFGDEDCASFGGWE
jgi:hypothetical protein